ncbi:DcaP family trimeric outer membrane transporter [Paracoccus pantotrophus]|uniref:DcaP family trimeric outer membrane transporter n=1 Tax=Paracoccus pantotrophus TaxID=82367 RepID=UPI00048EE594|nr:DcaP family trimeric outer membrane transporter [Paracoccus pantotrophus]
MKKHGIAARRGLYAAAALMAGTGLASAETLAALEARVAALEKEKAAVGSVSAAPGVKLTFYGHAKMDVIGDNNYDLGNTTGAMAGITAASTEDGGTGGAAFETRLGLKGTIDTDIGQVKFNLEGDFYGATGGSGNFRLRHGYGEIGPLLAGQTWTNWMPSEGTPGAIQDFNGAAGGSNYRVAQVRYTYKPNDQWRLSVAVEEDYAPGTQSNLALTAFAGYTSPKLKVGMGLISRNLETNADESVHGFGYAIGADFEAWQGGKLQLQYVGGKAITTAMNNTGFSGIDIATGGRLAYDIDANGDAVKANAVKAGITQKLGEKSDVSFAYGVQRFDDYAGAGANFTKQIDSAHLTYRYFATKQVMFAAEVSHVEREQFDGAKFDNTRLQGVVKFTF